MKPHLIVYAATESGGIVLSGFDSHGMPQSLGNIPTYVKAPPRAILALHRSGKFLYAATGFDIKKDGYSYDAFQQGNAVPGRKATDIVVFAMQPNGALAMLQQIRIPGVLAGLMAHPSGHLLYGIGSGGGAAGTVGPGSSFAGPATKVSDPGGLPVFAIAHDGRLNLKGRTSALYTFGLMDMGGERDAWALDFSSDGRYAYSFCGDGFVDHAENYLQKFQVQADGRFVPSGPTITDYRTRVYAQNEVVSGWVFTVRGGKWATIKGFDDHLSLYMVDDQGHLHPHRKKIIPFHPVRKTNTPVNESVVKAADPKGRFLYTADYAGSESTNVSYLLDINKGAIPVDSFGSGNDLIVSPQGDFIFEMITRWVNLDENGQPMEPTPYPDWRFKVQRVNSRLSSYAVDLHGRVQHRANMQVLTADKITDTVVTSLS